MTAVLILGGMPLVLLCLCSFPYFAVVLPAYLLVRRRGRQFHASDLVALWTPLVAYTAFDTYQDRQGINCFEAVAVVGAFVAPCVLFRGWQKLSPWAWSIGTGTLGAAVAVITWLNIDFSPMLDRLF